MSVCYPKSRWGVTVLFIGSIEEYRMVCFPKVECDQVINMGQQVDYGKAKLEVGPVWE